MTRPIQVSKGVFGGHTVAYDCPKCRSRLKSPLEDAGKKDHCPECGAVFITPGADERDRLRAATEEESRLAKARKEEAKREREVQKQVKKEQLAIRKRQAITAAVVPQVPTAAPSPPTATVGAKTRPCPYCAEEILADAKKCKHCGEFLTPALRKQSGGNQKEKSGCNLILIIAFGIVLGVLLLALL